MNLRRALCLQLTALALGLGLLLWLAQSYPPLPAIARLRDTVGALGAKGAALWPLLYGACNLLLLPAGILALGSGLFFGLWWGFALNLLGNVLGAAGAFGISRTFGRRWIARRFLQNPRWAALDEAIAREGWKIILFTQLPPLSPVSLLAYLYGITRIRFGTCLLWVAIGQAPTMFLYAYLGTLAQHGVRLWQGHAAPTPGEYALWLGGLALTLLAILMLGRIARRALAAATAPPLAPASVIVEADAG